MSDNQDIDQWNPLVSKYARSAHVYSSAVGVEDLEQVGRMAVVKAIKTFDPTKGAKLQSYITRLVRQAIYNEAARFCGPITVPHTVPTLASKVQKLSGVVEDDSEIVSLLKSQYNKSVGLKGIDALRRLFSTRNPVSLDGSTSEAQAQEEVTECLVHALLSEMTLTDIETDILYSKIFADASDESIANKFDVSNKTFKSIESSLIQKVEKFIRENAE